jgi:hypothetical protein
MSPAKLLMLTGGLLFVAGAAWWLAERPGATGGAWSWIGRLPGDIRVERPSFSFYFPLATGLLASAALTALFWLFRRQAR